VALVCCLAVVASVAGVAATAAGTTERCQANGAQKVCLTDVTISDDTLVVNQTGTVEVTVENQGDQFVSPRVTMNTAGPNNTTSVVPVGQPELQPGETTTVTQPIAGDTPGQHGVQVILTAPDGTHRFDISTVQLVQVTADPPTELGGRIDATEISLGVLVVALLGAFVAGYRYFGPKTDPEE
jgi:CARDB.